MHATLPYLPLDFKQLFENPLSVTKVRSCNSIFAFMPMGASWRMTLGLTSNWKTLKKARTFSVLKKKCDSVGTLIPVESEKPSFVQLQAFDSDKRVQVNMRCCIMDGLEREIVAKIQRVLSQVYSFVLRAGEFIRNQEVLSVRLATHEAPGVDLRTQNHQRVKRWPPFYSRIMWGPNETLLCISEMWDYSELAISSRSTKHYTSLCCSHMVNEVDI